MPDRSSDTSERQLLIQVMTTGLFAVQSARSATIADASARAALFPSAVSSSLVALALVGQLSRLGAAFYVFAFLLLPTLCFLGVATFARVLQTALQDAVYVREIHRIRHFYAAAVPEAARYLLLSTHDEWDVGRDLDPTPPRWQSFLTTSGMLGVLNSVLAGVGVGLAAALAALGDAAAHAPLALGAGATRFAACAWAHHRYEALRWRRLYRRLPVLFPSAGAGGNQSQNPTGPTPRHL